MLCCVIRASRETLRDICIRQDKGGIFVWSGFLVCYRDDPGTYGLRSVVARLVCFVSGAKKKKKKKQAICDVGVNTIPSVMLDRFLSSVPYVLIRAVFDYCARGFCVKYRWVACYICMFFVILIGMHGFPRGGEG